MPDSALSLEVMDHGACDHFQGAPQKLKDKWGTRFRKMMLWVYTDEMSSHTKTQLELPHCKTCKKSLRRPFVCLSCRHTYCHQSVLSSAPGGSHIKAHGQVEKKHYFAVDSRTGGVWCHECEDYMYPDAFEQIKLECKRAVQDKMDKSSHKNIKAAQYQDWKSTYTLPSTAGLERIRCHTLRPLLNLSQTCFLSSILQSFIHNPLLRSYFLSDQHNRKVCALGRALKKEEAEDTFGNGSMVLTNGNGNGVGECICCEMDLAFSELYSNDQTPFGPTSLLYAMWKASDELAGYAQQDAHSFFLAALNQLHGHTEGASERPGKCGCIARESTDIWYVGLCRPLMGNGDSTDQAFAGSLLSTVTCSKCSSSTMTEDPILDLSLELKSVAPAAGGKGSVRLTDCLEKYTSRERLSHKAYVCAKCGPDAHAEATKQLSVRKLPSTLAIQLKRFEHTSTLFSKVETMVSFPATLDMRPYMSSTLSPSSVDVETDLPNDMYTYELYSVVTHEGKLDNGHYWADVKSGLEWFHCDDEKISGTTLSNALAQKAYMLFYVRSSISYDGKSS